MERDGSGYPVLKVPEGVNLWNEKDNVMSAGLTQATKFIQNLRRGTSEGAVLPFGWEIELLSSSSRRVMDINTAITRYETRIAMTCAADFLMLGQGSTGSWALSTDKTEMFTLALGGYLKQIKGVIDRHAIPPLLRFNNFDPSRPPSIEHGDIETQNLTELAQYLSALTTAGAVTFPDESLSRHLRLLAKLPEPPEDEEMPLLPPVEGEPEELTAEKRKWLRKSMGELREIMLAQKNGHANGTE
jgi:phage gp29-like protein